MASKHPSKFYGWRLVATAALGLFWGVPVTVFTFPVFVKPLMHDFHAGRAAVSFGYTLQSVAAACSAPLAGWLIDRKRARKVILPTGYDVWSSFDPQKSFPRTSHFEAPLAELGRADYGKPPLAQRCFRDRRFTSGIATTVSRCSAYPNPNQWWCALHSNWRVRHPAH